MKINFIMMTAMTFLVSSFSYFVKSDLKTDSAWFWWALGIGLIAILLMNNALDRVKQTENDEKEQRKRWEIREDERHQETLEAIRNINKQPKDK